MGLTDTLRQVRELYERMTASADRAEEAERKLTAGGDEARWKMAEAAEKADRLIKRLDRYAWTILGIALLAGLAGGGVVALYLYLVLLR